MVPRGVKRTIDYTTELEEIEQKIVKHKKQIESLEQRRKDVTDLQHRAETEKLMRFLSDAGISVSDAIQKLSDVDVSA